MNYKQIFLVMILVLSVFSISKIRFLDMMPGDGLEVFTSVMNSGSNDIDDVRVIAYMPEIGEIIRSNSFDMDKRDSYGKVMLWNGIPEGEYLVRISASNDEHRSVKYRYVTIG